MIIKREFIDIAGRHLNKDAGIDDPVPPECVSTAILNHRVHGMIDVFAWMESQTVSPFGKWLTLILSYFIQFQTFEILRIISPEDLSKINLTIVLNEVKPLHEVMLSGIIEKSESITEVLFNTLLTMEH
jgi:hypothetical protein